MSAQLCHQTPDDGAYYKRQREQKAKLEETGCIKGVENIGKTVTKSSETEGQCTCEIRLESHKERNIWRTNELLEIENDRMSEKQ